MNQPLTKTRNERTEWVLSKLGVLRNEMERMT